MLGLLAVHEAFQKMLDALRNLIWFRYMIPLVTCLALVAVVAVIQHSDAQLPQLGRVILALDVAVRYLQGGIFAVTLALSRFAHFPRRRHAAGIVDGFGIAAIGMLLASVLRLESGSSATFGRFAPAVAYVIAVLIWLSSFRAAPELPSPHPALEPDDVHKKLLAYIEQYRKGYKEAVRRLRSKT